jgi:hypothetical protein
MAETLVRAVFDCGRSEPNFERAAVFAFDCIAARTR